MSATAAPAWRELDIDKLFLGFCLFVPLTALTIFFAYPLLTVVTRSLTEADGGIGIGNYIRILNAPSFWRATVNSLVMSLSTTAAVLMCGLVVAYAVHRCKVPGRALLLGAVSLPLLAPSLVQGLGLIFLLGRNGIVTKTTGLDINIYGFWGLLIANGLYALPQAVLIIGAALRAADARIYEAAEILGTSGFRKFVDITLPNIKFGLLSAGFIVFTVTITDFGNAATIGGDYAILATEIYNQVVGQMNFNLGAVVGILLLLPTILSFYLERVASQRQFGSVSDSAVPLVPTFTPKRDVPMTLAAWLVALLPVVTVAIVIYGSFVWLWPYRFDLTLKHYAVKVAGGYDPLWTTVQISIVAGVIGSLMLFALGFSLQRLPRHIVKPIYFLCLLPAAVPGLVLGLAYIFAFNVPGLPVYALYGTATLLAICNVTHYWTQGFLTTMTGLRQVPPTLEESAACLGASLPRLVRDVIVPSMAPTLVSVFFFMFMRSMVTLSAVIFLITASVSVASVSIMRLDEAGFTSQAAAYATCTMGIVVVASVLMRACLWALKRKQ
ncbi:ABC transporter permease subunit [Microvirga terricola]|uniref:ABC transporter permease subunit n=1 Tax=Microvirga terricola TaxID=2719797 RepID=A0ABX0VAL2_9HYPH|nr:ABC transporter permease subunit [Microvirga terricola]NIX76040.1 ABC transporter permease subunit [Microvirga terricola]